MVRRTSRHRQAIRAELRAGATRQEIEGQLYATYGDAIRGAPQARGFGLLAWIIPALFFVGGAFVLWRWARPEGAHNHCVT